jgi:hypothetical protein
MATVYNIQSESEENLVTLVRISVHLITVDESYQRDKRPSIIKVLREEWDPYIAGAILVAPHSDGSFTVVDGQHRFEIMCERGWQKIPCFIKPTNTIADEVTAWLDANINKSNPTALEKHRARVRRGDPEPCDINRIVQQHGFWIATSKSGVMQYSKIQAIDAVTQIYKKGMLNEVLTFIESAWRGQSYAMTEGVLLGVFAFLQEYPEHNQAKLLGRAKRAGVDALLLRAKRFASLSKSTSALAFRDALFELYNRDTPSNKRLTLKG